MSKELAKQSNYFTHRDFHSRNIMQLNDGELALIDFQDARLGSPIYDGLRFASIHTYQLILKLDFLYSSRAWKRLKKLLVTKI